MGKLPHISDQPIPASADFNTCVINTIEDVKDYFLQFKENHDFLPQISNTSEQLIDQWGKVETPQQIDSLFFSQGPETANIYIVDSDSRFFKTESGKLLNKILSAMNLSQDQIFICNCDDLEALNAKINIHSPKIIITLGSKAGKLICKTENPLTEFRGRFFEYQGVKVMPTFHPSLLIKDPQYKRQVWEDMKQVMAVAGLNPDA